MHVIASLALAVAALSSLGRGGLAQAAVLAPGTAGPVLVAQVAPPCQVGQRYLPPVNAPITDPFRAPASPFGPGNRGLEYGTTPGQTIRAIGGGVVTFAGSIGGSRYVTVAHADGLRSSYSFLAEVSVAEREVVVAGQPVGRAGLRFHLGVRCGDAYLDPASLVATGRWRARLVPDSRFPSS